EAQRATSIRARYLDALETERFDLLPGDFYTRSCLREYAQLLGLDGDLLVEEYRRQYPEPDEALVLPPAHGRRWAVWSPARAAVALAVVAALVGSLVLAFRPSSSPKPVAAAPA